MIMKNESDSSTVFIKLFLEKVFALRYIYLAFIVLFLTTAFLLNKYSSKVYEIESTIGPVQENRSTVLSSNQMFRGLGTYNTGKNVDDAINSLNSFSLISSTISNLNLEVGYFTEKNSLFRQTIEFYMNSPYRVNIDKSHLQPINTKFYITILNDSTYRLSAINKETSLYNYIDNITVSSDANFTIDTISQFNKTITGRNYKFSISKNTELLPSNNSEKALFYFELFHVEELAKLYLNNIKIEPVSVLASIINIKFTGKNIEKSLGFLNTYINYFLNDNLAKKNKIAVNTINFIDSQISEISDSLSKSESNLRNFRTTNQVTTDLSFQGQQIYGQMAQIETQRTSLEVQSRYYNYVINLFKTNQDVSGVVPPASANVTDQVMNKLITDLLALNSERSGIISNNNNEKNLFLAQIDNKIKNQKQAIIESVTNNLNTINLTLNELNYRSDKLSKDISNLPKTEMNMVNIQRKFNLNDAIFTYLLQKRSEAAISLASNYPDYEVLEPAREITSKIIKPKKIMNYLFSLFLGLLFPTIFLITRDFFNDKVSSIYDIEHLLDRPVFGIIYNNPKKYEAVVAEAPKSAISESFRNLRGSLFIKLKSEQSKVILITSSQPQEGKSFISFNLAASIASVGFKTVIIDCDLRRPTLHIKFKENNSSGISNFMTRNANEDEIIHKTSVDNLSFIPAGPLLPNPSELLDSGILDDLMDLLKSRFEFIIIDTPPVGLVADSIQLMKYANQILVVSRNNVTRKEILVNALTSLDSNKIANYEVILNDLDLNKSPYSGYKNYYLKE
jgi:capsular exopolysaccharide synthesis family protein